MTNVASRYNSYPVLVIDLGNIRPHDLVCQAHKLSRATQVAVCASYGHPPCDPCQIFERCDSAQSACRMCCNLHGSVLRRGHAHPAPEPRARRRSVTSLVQRPCSYTRSCSN